VAAMQLLESSIALFNHALHVTKNNYLAYNARGVIYAKFGQYQQAIEDFNEAIRLQPFMPMPTITGACLR